MMGNDYKIGDIVINPKKPDWGPGKIVAIAGGLLTVYFRDDHEDSKKDGTRDISTAHVALKRADSQVDSLLDNLPPFDKGVLGKAKKPLRLVQCLEWFQTKYPRGFADRTYIGDQHEGERAYKLAAHEQWVRTLDGNQGQRLLQDQQINEFARRLLAVEQKAVNLLSQYEKMALRDALRDEIAATSFMSNLLNLIDAMEITETVFTQYLQAVLNLPAEEGRARVASWPVATLFPYLARPERFMFLKPTITCAVAEIMGFDLHYDARPNWVTYSQVSKLAGILMEHLRPIGARDMIDVQSFMFLIYKWVANPR